MARVFHKFSRLVLLAALAGVTIPQLASAGDRGGNNFSKMMKSGGGNQFRNMNVGNSSQISRVLKTSKVANSKPINPKLNNPVWNKPLIKTTPGKGLDTKVTMPGKITKFPSRVISQGPLTGGEKPPVLNPFPGGKPPVVIPPVINPFPGGGKPPVLDPFPGGKPPIVKPPVINPFPGGGKPPVLDPFPGGKPPVVKPPVINPFPGGGKPPVLDPFPGGKPPVVKPPVINPFPGGGKPPVLDPVPGGNPPIDPVPGGNPPIDPGTGGNPPIDPGTGAGNGGGNCPPQNEHCHKNPWPIFWPAYNSGYWNNYNSGYCTTPTVVVNEVPPVVVNEVTPVSATVPAAVIPATGANGVDLVLEDIQYVEPATLLVGPAYRVKFRNQGLAAAGAFRVAIVASLNGTADARSPMALVDVAGLASGESSEVTVRLPRTAMQLATADGQATVFTHLLVAADLDNLIGEADKANNVAIVERTQLEVAVK